MEDKQQNRLLENLIINSLIRESPYTKSKLIGKEKEINDLFMNKTVEIVVRGGGTNIELKDYLIKKIEFKHNCIYIERDKDRIRHPIKEGKFSLDKDEYRFEISSPHGPLDYLTIYLTK